MINDYTILMKEEVYTASNPTEISSHEHVVNARATSYTSSLYLATTEKLKLNNLHIIRLKQLSAVLGVLRRGHNV